ncbi:MAG: protein kinase [Myxococcales bacterium]|nr:protein kinase [Myxococcales bacterium]
MVLRKIGEGSMGVVYAGYDVALDRKVALKLVQRKLVNKPRIRARMVREAQALARLSSPYVVQVYQVGEHADGIYLAMEYVEGEDLRAWFRDPKIGWRQLLRALCDAGRGLAAAHAAGLIHRDFKPENVLVGRDGRARVLDFGLVLSEGEDDLEDDDGSMVGPVADAKALMATMEATESPPPEVTTRRPRMRRVAGTPAYMSPEQHFGGAVGPASDLFSFAITVYEALYGVRPFEGSSWREIQEKVRRGVIPPPPPDSPVPRWLFRVVQRGLQRAPEDRWPDIEAMVAALEKEVGELQDRLRKLEDEVNKLRDRAKGAAKDAGGDGEAKGDAEGDAKAQTDAKAQADAREGGDAGTPGGAEG